MPSKMHWMRKVKSSLFVNENMKYFVDWRTLYLKATDADRTNENDTAVTLYERLHSEMFSFVKTEKNEMELTNKQLMTMEKIAHCIKCRINAIQLGGLHDLMVFEEIIKLKPVFRDLLSWNEIFPIPDLAENHPWSASSVVSLLSNDSGLEDLFTSEDEQEDSASEQLLPRLPKRKGLTRMLIKIEKIGLKHTKLIDPYITISVRDSASVHLTPLQNTTLPRSVEDYYLNFDTKYELQKYVENIPKGTVIFFELKHRKNGKLETKCFAVLRRNLFESSTGWLTLYKGPTNYHLKNLTKLSKKKPLYLHLEIKMLS